MSMNRFRMEEANMFDAADQWNAVSHELVNTHDTSKGSFTGMKSSGMFAQGFSDIEGQVGSIANSIGQVSKMVNEHTNTIRGIDEQGVKEVEQIEVPQDFVANNSMQINEFNQSILEKLDGKHVNSKDETLPVEEIADSTVERVNNLDDITKGATNEQVYDDRVGIAEQQKLANIDNPDGLDEQKLDASSSINEQVQLANINNEDGLRNQKINEDTVVQKVGLGDINNGEQVTKKELDASYNSIEDAAIEDMAGSPKSEASKG